MWRRRISVGMLFILISVLVPITAQAEEKAAVRVGYYNDSVEFQWGASDTERKKGYAYEYYQEIAKYTGWTYEYVYGDSFADIYQMLVTGEVDMIAGVSKTNDKMEEVLFPDYAMGGDNYYIFGPKGGTEYSPEDTDALNGARIGVKAESYMSTLIEKYAQENDFTCETVMYDSLEDRVEAIERGELDYIATVENDRMPGLKPIYNLGSWDYYFAVNRNRADILAELNEAQEQMRISSPYYTAYLEDKYFNNGLAVYTLTEEEKEWTAQKQELTIGYLTDYMPFCDIDDETGELRGLLGELLPELSEMIEMDLDTCAYTGYADMIQALETGEVDLVFPTLGDLWYSEKQSHVQSDAVVSSRLSVVYKGEYNSSIYDRIAYSAGSPLQDFYLTSIYPDAELVMYEDWGDCLKAIQTGKAGCLLIGSDLLTQYMNAHPQYADLQVAELGTPVEYCFAARRSANVLYSVMYKAMNTVDDTFISDALVRNSYVEREYTIWEFLASHVMLVCVLGLGFIGILIVFFLLYRGRILHNKALLQQAYEKELEHAREQEKTQMAIQELYETASRANQVKSDFLARMSHDIRTPLNAILGMTVIARTHIDDKQSVTDCLDKVDESGRHLLELVNEILDLSKIESGKVELTEDKFNLKELMDNCLLMIQTQCKGRKQNIELSYENLIHENVIGDSAHIKKVFMSIIGNSVKYTPEGGNIHIYVKELPTDNLKISYYKFIFEDNGIGMSKEFIKHIFEPFTREDDVGKGEGGGSGLELSIVYNIIRVMGGDIKVESERGKGSKFTVSLDLQLSDSSKKVEEPKRESDVEQIAQADFSGKRVLLVEDNDFNAEIVIEILKMTGVELDHVWNGHEALDILREKEPYTYDMVFMDIQMPIMNGYEATRAIRAEDREDLKSIPIVAMSANAFSEDIRTAIESGMNAHIAKPLEMKRLMEVMSEYLR